MKEIGISPTIDDTIEFMQDKTKCTILINNSITDQINVNVRVWLGCLLSPTLFNILLELIMNEPVSLQQNLNLDESLTIDICYANDTTLISAKKNNISSFFKLQLT